MKTFETEKHNIPEGATHYQNECSRRSFAWFRNFTDESVQVMTANGMVWHDVGAKGYAGIAIPIPQTNVETPEEEEVEWANGDECNYGGVDGFIVGYCRDVKWIVIEHSGEVEAVNVEHVSKPETEAERVEREGLEAAYDLYFTLNNGRNCVGFDRFKISCNNWLRVVDKTNYRKKG